MNNNGLVRPYQSLLSAAQKFLDAFIVYGSFMLSAYLSNQFWTGDYNVAATLAVALFYIASSYHSVYGSWRGQTITLELWHVAKSWATVVLGLVLIAFFTKTSDSFSRQVIGLWWIIGPLLTSAAHIGSRLALRYARASGLNTRTAAIVGAGELGVLFAQRLINSPWMGISVKGFYDDYLEVGHRPVAGCDLQVLGTLQQVAVDSKHGDHDQVFVTLPMRAEQKTKQLLQQLRDTTTTVHFVPDIFTFNLVNSRIRDFNGIPTISVYDSPLSNVGRILKRAEDIVISSLILTLAALPMMAIAIAVKLSSPGPVIFKQRRYGLNGQKIYVWKFRSMSVCEDGWDVTQAVVGDARVTRIGRLLRKTSLDELPQFFNVLQGSMAIVGPRPHALLHNEQYRSIIEGYMQRHLMKPGITGWAQIHGWRGETDTLEKMEKRVYYDMDYINNWSLTLDLKIIALTPFYGLRSKNAY